MAHSKGFYDGPMWEGFARRRMLLQCCDSCGAFRYPPAASCAKCLSPQHQWIEVEGQGKIITWAIFHRQYLPNYPAPYNVIAVQLAEGPIMISNLEGDVPEGLWVGHDVRLVWAESGDLGLLPRFELRP